MEKFKIYLDTNLIHDIFTNQAKGLRKRETPEKPRKFIFMLDNQARFHFITSFLTKAEIMRELVSAHNVESDRVEQFWSEFMSALNPKYVKEFTFDDQIVELAGRLKMKLRTMINFFHLFIAIKEGAYFVSGDKQIIDKIKKSGIYENVLDYVELQKLPDASP